MPTDLVAFKCAGRPLVLTSTQTGSSSSTTNQRSIAPASATRPPCACCSRTGVARVPGVVIDVAEVESNIVVFRLAPGSPPVPAVVDRMKKAGVLVLGFRGGIRAVTHLQVA